MDTAQWPQRIGLVRPMEELETSSTNNTSTANNACSTTRPQLVERKPRPQREQALNCPRCTSTNTKFCYYNNYSLTQPRYFCKTCRRYWTEGGSLRNVPVGGGSRKNKRSYTSTTTSSSTTTTTTNNNNNNTNTTTGSSVSTSMKLPSGLIPSPISLQNPKFLEGQDLNLSFPSHSMPQFGDFPNIGSNNSSNSSNKPSTAFGSLSAMELLRSKISAKGLGPFMPMQMAMPEAGVGYPSGFDLQDMKPCTAGLNLDGIGVGGEGGGSGYGSIQGVQDSGRLLFPFEDLRQVSSGASVEFEQNRGQGGDPPAFWNGMMGGGGGGGPW